MIENVFHAMGTTIRVLLPDEDVTMFDFVVARVAHLESLWSRFIPSSDISVLAHAEGKPTLVAAETIELAEQLVAAHIATDGYFDPTVMPALYEAGYSKSKVDDRISVEPSDTFIGNIADIKIDAATNHVTLPKGMSLDAGGLGKGLAADVVARDLLDMGVQGVSISMGGDVALAGTPDDGENWVIDIGAPNDYSQVVDTVRMRGGGVATSTLAARTWESDGEFRHHVIDPRTLKPVEISDRSTLQATVIAGSAAWAEAFSTALTVCEPKNAEGLVARHGLAAMLILHDGTQIEIGSWAGFR